jgi:GTP-binding protein
MRFKHFKPVSKIKTARLAFFLLLQSANVLAFAPNWHRRDPSKVSPRYETSSEEIESASIVEEDSSATYFSPNRPLDRERFDEITDDVDQEAASIDSGANEYSFFDEATIYVRAGSGGQGSSTYKKGTGGQDGPPDGGSGGKGGDVIMIVDDSLNTLAGLTNAWRPNSFGGSGAASQNRDQRKSFRAENGSDGGRQIKNGKYGNQFTIRVPPGTVVQEVVERDDGNEELFDMGSLVLDEPSLIVALGGEGGEGSGINAKGRGVKRPRLPPEGGERRMLRLTLKIVADVALVGVPNAGKSTFLASVTRAKPKIANVRNHNADVPQIMLLLP